MVVHDLQIYTTVGVTGKGASKPTRSKVWTAFWCSALQTTIRQSSPPLAMKLPCSLQVTLLMELA